MKIRSYFSNLWEKRKWPKQRKKKQPSLFTKAKKKWSESGQEEWEDIFCIVADSSSSFLSPPFFSSSPIAFHIVESFLRWTAEVWELSWRERKKKVNKSGWTRSDLQSLFLLNYCCNILARGWEQYIFSRPLGEKRLLKAFLPHQEQKGNEHKKKEPAACKLGEWHKGIHPRLPSSFSLGSISSGRKRLPKNKFNIQGLTTRKNEEIKEEG